MCVIVVKPHDKEVSKETLELCFNHNAHGAGFMYPDGKKVVIRKGFFTFDAFYAAYMEHLEGPAKETPVVLHFRIATSGEKDEVNCHPHRIADDFAFVHNGVMSEYAYIGEGADKFSDTVHFGQDVLLPQYQKWGPSFLQKGDLYYMIQKYISPSKMVFLNAKSYWIAGKTSGEEIGGVWFSNTHWKPYERTSNYGYNGATYGMPQGEWCRVNGEWVDVSKKIEDATAPTIQTHLRSASANGCYLPHLPNPGSTRMGRFVKWGEYAELYPKYDGPYEWWLKGWKSPEGPGGEAKEVLTASETRLARVKKKCQKKGETVPLLLGPTASPEPDIMGDIRSGDILSRWPVDRCCICTSLLTRKEMERNAVLCGLCDGYPLGASASRY